MVKAANDSMRDADAVVLVVDGSREMGQVEENVIDYVKKSGVPAILVLNKVDLYRREIIAETIQSYADKHSFDAFVPVSAKKGDKVAAVLEECSKFLSESEWFFPDDIVTDQPVRQMAAEIIREKILRTLNKEIPHGVAVVIEEFKEDGGLVRIRAEIFCEKESHKGIIVGKGGRELKMIGTYAREDLEKMLDKKVFLDLWVKVKENWRESAKTVGNFGYQNED